MQILNNSARVLFIISLGGQRHKKQTGHLFNIQQAKRESLRQYVNRFNKELLQVDEAEDQVILTTFQAGLLPGDFFFSITKSPPKTIIGLLRKTQKYMNVEDVVLAKEMKGKRKRDEEQAVIAIRRRRH